MSSNRRYFLKQLAGITSFLVAGGKADASHLPVRADQWGVLVDTTKCVGCRSCEKACNEINTDLPRRPADDFRDDSVFQTRRRMDHSAYTVVNRYESPQGDGKTVYSKFQCMHCLYPACESACIVGAFERQATGPVVYDSWKCIGCRYCMAACPFQVPGYEYENALTPRVRKCTFCFETRLSKGGLPACVQACPMQVMTFGKRNALITHAHTLIRTNPGRYVPHLYGEKEVGGTAWMYLAGVPFQTIDLPTMGYHPAPAYTEPIQHAIFKWFLPPLGVYGALGGIMWYLNAKKKRDEE